MTTENLKIANKKVEEISLLQNEIELLDNEENYFKITAGSHNSHNEIKLDDDFERELRSKIINQKKIDLQVLIEQFKRI